MADYVISCCSTADLSEEYFKKRNIEYVCFHYYMNDKPYMDDLGKTMSIEEFYQAMVDGAETRTSQVNAEEYVAFFEPFLEAGKDIIHLTLSSGISGTYNSAVIAQSMLQEKYPERTIYIIDSLTASSGFGLFMDTLADKRDAGMGVDELAEWCLENRGKMNAWFFSTDLTFFIKGGRVSKTAGTIGGILGVCPLLNINNEGKLIPRANIRGKKKVIKEIVKKMQENIENPESYDGKCFISHSVCEEDAKAVAALVEENFPNLNGPVELFNIGTTIGSHTGPGTVALFFWGKERTI